MASRRSYYVRHVRRHAGNGIWHYICDATQRNESGKSFTPIRHGTATHTHTTTYTHTHCKCEIFYGKHVVCEELTPTFGGYTHTFTCNIPRKHTLSAPCGSDVPCKAMSYLCVQGSNKTFHTVTVVFVSVLASRYADANRPTSQPAKLPASRLVCVPRAIYVVQRQFGVKETHDAKLWLQPNLKLFWLNRYIIERQAGILKRFKKYVLKSECSHRLDSKLIPHSIHFLYSLFLCVKCSNLNVHYIERETFYLKSEIFEQIHLVPILTCQSILRSSQTYGINYYTRPARYFSTIAKWLRDFGTTNTTYSPPLCQRQRL